MIEPKPEFVNQPGFDVSTLKNSAIASILLTEENKKKGYAENSDSTNKLLIYQIPFSEVTQLSRVITQLE